MPPVGDLSPPLSQAYDLPVPLSVEPLLSLTNFVKNFPFKASPERGGGPPLGGGGVLNPSALPTP